MYQRLFDLWAEGEGKESYWLTGAGREERGGRGRKGEGKESCWLTGASSGKREESRGGRGRMPALREY
jgi:hypothetical protein